MEIDGKKITIILPYRGSTIMRILLAITLLTVSGKHAQPDTGVLAADSKCKGGTDTPSDQCYVVELVGIHDLRTIGRAHFLWLILFVKKMESISKFRSKLENIAAEFMDTVNVGIFHCSHMAQNESAQNPCLVDMQTFFAPNAKTSVSSRLESGFYRAYNFHYLPTILSLENSTHELIEWINQAFPLPNLPLVNVDIGIEKLSFSVSFSRRLFAVLTPKELQDISFQRHLRAACHVFHPDVECYIIRVKDLSEASALHVTKSGLTLVSYPHYLDMENYVLLHFPKQNLIQTGFFDIIKWFFHDGAVPLSVGYGIGGDVADFDTSALSEDDFEDLIVEGTLEQERWLQRLQNRDRSKKANGPQSDDNHQQES